MTDDSFAMGWRAASLGMGPAMLTVADLIAELQKLPGYMWVCVGELPVIGLHPEPGAGEPFVVLLTPDVRPAVSAPGEYGYSLDTEICWHGQPKAICNQCTTDSAAPRLIGATEPCDRCHRPVTMPPEIAGKPRQEPFIVHCTNCYAPVFP